MRSLAAYLSLFNGGDIAKEASDLAKEGQRQLMPLSWQVSLRLSERWWGLWHCLLV